MKKIIDFIVISNLRLNSDHFVLWLRSPDELPACQPGQFVEVSIPGNPDVFLRRPFSIHDADPENGLLALFIKIVGKGTQSLSQVKAGDVLNLILPLGNGFRLPQRNGKILVIGGGCGIAPLLYLCKVLAQQGKCPDILLGAKTSEDLLLTDEFSKYGNLYAATEDGSHSEKGLVTQHPLINQAGLPYTIFYTCGPTPMLQAVASIAEAHGIPCQVSLENTMACGIGACLCCVVRTTTGHRCVCTDGPVFDIQELDGWHQPIVKCDL